MAKRLRRHHSTKLKTHGQEHRAGQKCLCASFQYCRQAIWEHFNQRAGNAFKTDLGLRLSMDFSMDLPTTVVLFVSPRFAHNLGCLADISLAWILKRARGPKQTDMSVQSNCWSDTKPHAGAQIATFHTCLPPKLHFQEQKSPESTTQHNFLEHQQMYPHIFDINPAIRFYRKIEGQYTVHLPYRFRAAENAICWSC